MNCQEEFFEVNVSVIVLVEVSEDVVTKLFCVCRHEAGAVYVHEGLKIKVGTKYGVGHSGIGHMSC